VLRLGHDEERSRLWALFLGATCFVMPSLLEPSAVAYTEAAAAGIGSIGTRNGGSADLIGDAGIVVNPNDDEEIAMAMLTAADPAVAADLGARAQRRAQLLTWRAVGARLLAALALGPPEAPLITPGGDTASGVTRDA
jgi:glycosyltransferase involved in cell wall biosynthesis